MLLVEAHPGPMPRNKQALGPRHRGGAGVHPNCCPPLDRPSGRGGAALSRPWTHLACWVCHRCSPCSRCERRRLWPEPINSDGRSRRTGRAAPPTSAGRSSTQPTMGHDPGADLHQLLAQRRQRPLRLPRSAAPGCAGNWLDCIGEREQLQAHRVVSEGAAGQPRRAQRLLALP
jgi:hypothetical protein